MRAATGGAAAAAALLLAGGPRAATLHAGAGESFNVPSAAIAAAQPGDTVLIAPGTYYDCAVVHTGRLTIAGDGEAASVVLTDTTCQGKAIIVAAAGDLTLRNLTLQRARVPDRNGAGVRAEQRNLTLDHVRVLNNEIGILANDVAGSTLRIADGTFSGNRGADIRCGSVALLRIEGSAFVGDSASSGIVSAADRTELIGNTISGGGEALVSLPRGGELLAQDNKFASYGLMMKAVILIGAAERGRADAKQVVSGNTLNASSHPPPLVLNWGAADPSVAENTVPEGGTGSSTSGALWNRVRGVLSAVKGRVVDALGLAHRAIAKVF